MKAHRCVLARCVILIVGAFVVLCFWMKMRSDSVELTRRTTKLQGELIRTRQKLVANDAELHSIAGATQSARFQRDRSLAELRQVEEALVKEFPDAKWALPPAQLPEWSENSPYIWLKKEQLLELPVSPFDSNGHLLSEVALVLVLDPDQQARLSTELPKLLQEYRELAVARAERLNERLPNASKEGDYVAVRIPDLPDDGMRLQLEFSKVLRDTIGEQRADLLGRLGSSWLQEEFGHTGVQFGNDVDGTFITVVRQPNGYFNIVKRSKITSSSTSVPEKFFRKDSSVYIPAYLRPLFADILPPPDSGASDE